MKNFLCFMMSMLLFATISLVSFSSHAATDSPDYMLKIEKLSIEKITISVESKTFYEQHRQVICSNSDNAILISSNFIFSYVFLDPGKVSYKKPNHNILEQKFASIHKISGANYKQPSLGFKTCYHNKV